MSHLPGINVVEVRSMDDFPDPIAGKINLVDGVYRLQVTLVTPYEFVIPDGAIIKIIGNDAFATGIICTGTGVMFSGADFTGLSFPEVFLSTPLGTVFSILNISKTLGELYINDTFIYDCAHMGTIQNIQELSGYFNSFTDIGTGLLVDGVNIFGFGQVLFGGWKNEVTSMITFDGIIENIGLSNMPLKTNSNESVFDFKNTLTLAQSTIIGCGYNNDNGGTVFAAGSRDEKDPHINFQANSNISKSIVFGNMYLPTSETVTINTLGVPEIVNDTNTGGTNIWTELGDTSRFTFDSSLGRFTYIGLEDVTVSTIVSSSIEKQGGGSEFIVTFIAKNDTVLPESKSGTRNSFPTNVVSIANIALVTGDYIEMAVQNDEGTDNIVIEVSNFIIKD